MVAAKNIDLGKNPAKTLKHAHSEVHRGKPDSLSVVENIPAMYKYVTAFHLALKERKHEFVEALSEMPLPNLLIVFETEVGV